ncbi:MAG TPA: hypothetical protein VF516_17980 [Kofleriaceae bacterium]
MRTTTLGGGAAASAGFDQLQLTQSRRSIQNRSNRGSPLDTADMMRRMVLLAGNPGGSSVHASYGGKGR